MFCKKCGNQLREGARFCPRCGAPAGVSPREGKTAENAPEQVHPGQGIPEASGPEHPEEAAAQGKASRRKWFRHSAIVVIILAVTAASMAVMLLLYRSRHRKQEAAETATEAFREMEASPESQPAGSDAAPETAEPTAAETEAPTEGTEAASEEPVEFSFGEGEWDRLQFTASTLLQVLDDGRLDSGQPWQTKDMTANELGTFAHWYLSNGDIYGTDQLFPLDGDYAASLGGGYEACSEEVAKELLRSALGVETGETLTHQLQNGTETYDYLFYQDGYYSWMMADGAPFYYARPYRITRQGNTVTTWLENICVSNVGTSCAGLYQVVWQADPGSRLGYTAQSVALLPESAPEITGLTASSTLASDEPGKYAVENLVDRNLSTAWVEGMDGLGEGQWVQLDFGEETVLHGLRIADGYWKDWEIYRENARPTALLLEFSDGTRQEVRLGSFERSDSLGGSPVGVASENPVTQSGPDQWESVKTTVGFISFGREITTRSVRITILETEAGTSFADTCISEISVY